MDADPTRIERTPPLLRRRSMRALVAVPIVIAAVVVMFLNSIGAHFKCFDENTSCARGGPPRLWLGRVYTQQGAPAAFATVTYYFESVRGGPTLVTDSEGRYCLRWPPEESPAYATALTRRPGGRPDPRYAALGRRLSARQRERGRPSAETVIVSPANAERPLWNGYGGTVTSVGWDPATDTARHCVSAAPPWYDVDNLESNWRYLALILGPLAAIVLAIAGVAPRHGHRVTLASLVLSASTIGLFIAAWRL